MISRPSSAISRPNLAGGSAKHGFLSPSPPLWARKHDITTIFDHHRLSTNFFGFNPRLFLARSNLSLFPEGSTWDPHKSHERDNFFPLPRDEKRRMMKEKKGKNFLIPRERTRKKRRVHAYWVSIRTCRALITYTREGEGEGMSVMDFH